MDIEWALRLTEILLGWAFLLQSFEQLKNAHYRNERLIYSIRLFLSLKLIFGFFPLIAGSGLLAIGLYSLHRYQGPYNGGSDKMSLLILTCFTVAQSSPQTSIAEYALGYLALQVILSYFMAGWVKLKNPEWRSGIALQNVFLFSAYPVSENVRRWAQKPKLLRFMSWAVIVFEVLFPFSLMTPLALIPALIIAALFHLVNVFLFGLNRFFWIWLTSYPSILWLQDRVLL